MSNTKLIWEKLEERGKKRIGNGLRSVVEVSHSGL